MYIIGAVFYAVWGVLHLGAAKRGFDLAKSQEPGPVQGRLYQNAWNLAFAAVFVILIAVIYNLKNSPMGYWLNLSLASITDIGFIIFVLIPGYISLREGILGPVLWILAVIFSTLGILAA
ncbi:MAG: hypothetical protein WAM60_00935 [Candidatus Promineifilaceae bacterium]